MFHGSFPKTALTWLTILLVTSFIAIGGRVTAQTLPCFAWVQDHNILDSQFGVYDGTSAQYVGGIYPGFDIEGLAFINGVLYAASGGDGRVPSKLFTVTLDVVNNSSALHEIGPIQTVDGAPYYEVSSLADRNDHTLWGFAAEGEHTGLLQIDPATGIATLMVPSTLDVAGLTWIDAVLWLAAGDRLYTWAPGGLITPAFKVQSVNEIEALETINGLLYIGVHDTPKVMVVDPATGQIVPDLGFSSPDDIEGLALYAGCTAATPTPTSTATDTLVAPTLTATMTATPTPTPTATNALAPTLTATPTATPTPTSTATPTDMAVAIITPTDTATVTATPKPTTAVEPPNAIMLARFVATVRASDVALAWETGAEIDTVGFRLWRSTDGQRQSAVPIGDFFGHKGTSTSGAIYTYVDAAVAPGVLYTYWLEEVQRDGSTADVAAIAALVTNPLYLPLVIR